MFRSKFAIILAVIALGSAPLGCGDDDDQPSGTGGVGNTGGSSSTGGLNATGGSENQTLATISGTITYEGTKEGPLLVSIHSSFPPSMTNVMGFTQVEEPSFPAEYTVEEVPPGEYFVVSYISVGMFHVGAGPGDPQGAYVGDGEMPTPVTVSDSGATGVDITLTEQ